MDAGVLKEKVEEALRTLSDAQNAAESAENEAGDARRNADDAQGYAQTAFEDADRAEDYAIDCKREIASVQETLDELMALLSEETGDEVSLDVQIKRYGPKIRELRSRGCDADDIARRLSISSVIVNVVMERLEANASF